MALSWTSFCQKIIEYSFYALFFAVPFAFSGVNYELFEFNKMWLTFGLAVVIGAAWFCLMILKKEFKIQRTPLDIPILLFLLSQIVSTIFSLDTHVSFWGYYSRFNGGLLSIITYVFLYFAFVTAFPKEKITRLIKAVLIGGVAVALWGLPSHFGYDPTCLLFRGTLDVSCWTDAFQPKIRIFSTLGQPNWLAAYLAVLIPLSLAMGMNYYKTFGVQDKKHQTLQKSFFIPILYFILTILFFVDLLFTKSQSGFLGLISGILVFILLYRFSAKHTNKSVMPEKKFLFSFFIVVLVLSFFLEHSVSLFGIQKYTTFTGITNLIHPDVNTSKELQSAPGELGGTDSFAIRKLVWRGAIDVWKHYPLIGSGVETFAFSYYKYRPSEHNMTSEWDYLYNKAHNEYLNYLATTGTFGFATYIFIIGLFFFHIVKMRRTLSLLSIGLIAGYITILISNLPGFSVVIINLLFFLIPAFVYMIEHKLDYSHQRIIPSRIFFPFLSLKKVPSKLAEVKYLQIIWITLICITAVWMLYTLLAYWQADKAYGTGYNLNRTGEYQDAFSSLSTAVLLRQDEPTFLDELSYTTGVLAVALSSQNEATSSAQFAKEALRLNDIVVTNHPNNIVFWKTRVRLLYALSQLNDSYTPNALNAIQKTHELAPTDAKVSYNLGLMYGQTGQKHKAIDTLKKTIALKPDYKDAYFALALFYRDLAIDKNDRIIDADMQKKATETLRFILKNLAPNDESSKKTLKQWGETV